LPYREDGKLAGSAPYDVSKSCADLIAHMYANTFSLPVVIARCGNVYGSGDLHWSRLVPDAMRSLVTQIPLRVRSDGKSVRDYVYVDDVVWAYRQLAENVQKQKLHGEAFNFGTHVPLSVHDILREISVAAGSNVPYAIQNSASHEIRNQYLDSRKALRILGWRPRTSRTQALKRTIQWYKHFLASSL
jgi:CDP-glucose 4,6-dehydratase